MFILLFLIVHALNFTLVQSAVLFVVVQQNLDSCIMAKEVWVMRSEVINVNITGVPNYVSFAIAEVTWKDTTINVLHNVGFPRYFSLNLPTDAADSKSNVLKLCLSFISRDQCLVSCETNIYIKDTDMAIPKSNPPTNDLTSVWIALGVVGGLVIIAQTAAVIYFKTQAQKASLKRRMTRDESRNDEDRSRYSSFPVHPGPQGKKLPTTREEYGNERDSHTYEFVEFPRLGKFRGLSYFRPSKHAPAMPVQLTRSPMLAKHEPHPSPNFRAERQNQITVANAITNRPPYPLPEEIYEEIPNPPNRLDRNEKPSFLQASPQTMQLPKPRLAAPSDSQQVINSRTTPRSPIPRPKEALVSPAINELENILKKRRNEPPGVLPTPTRHPPASNPNMAIPNSSGREDVQPKVTPPLKKPPTVLAKPIRKPPIPIPPESSSPTRASESYGEWTYEALKPLEEVIKYEK